MATTIQQIETPKHARALDTSGNNNHGQIYSGRALEFDGVTDYLDTEIAFSETTHTIAVWAKANNDGNSKTLVDARDALTDGIKVSFKTDERIQYKINDAELDGVTTIPSVWTRIVVTYDGSIQKIYINGILDKSASVTKTVATTQTTKIGRKAYTASNYHNGFISDVQMWDAAWSAEDVSYDYLNPESLVLNRSGTSLTNSNLKLWYPMQDGHRGQQSHVLDASNTGLGDDLINNGDFATSGTPTMSSYSLGWRQGNADDDGTNITGGELIFTHTASSGSNYTRAYATNGKPGGLGGALLTLVVGTTYKFTYTVSNVVSGSTTLSYYDGDSYNGMEETVGTHIIYFTPTSANYFIIKTTHGEASEIRLSYVSLEPVNDKNPATTVFHGDNLLAGVSGAADGDWEDSGNTPTFTAVYAGGSGSGLTYDPDNTSSPLTGSKDAKVTNAAGEDAGIISNAITLVTGRRYRLKYNYLTNYNASSQTNPLYVKIGETSATNSTNIDSAGGYAQATLQATSKTAVSLEFTHTDSDTEVVLVFFGGNGLVFQIDDLSLVEVGTASGWTDADQQLHIPQTVLQSYNELLWMQGQEVDGVETDNVPITISSNVWNPASNNVPSGSALDWNTISSWIFFTEDSFDDTAFPFRIASSDPNLYVLPSGSDANIGMNTGAGELVGVTIAQSTLINKWHHIVMAWKPIASPADIAFGTINGSGVGVEAKATINDTDATGSADLTEITVSSVPSAMVKYSRLKYMKGTTTPTGDQGSGVAAQNCAIITNITGNTITFNDAIRFENGEEITVEVYNTNNFDSHIRLWINGEKQDITQVSNYHSHALVTTAQSDLTIGDSTTDDNAYSHQGIITEVSAWNKDLSTSEVQELYNDGKALNATTHSAVANLKGYWRNNGLSTWKDLVQSNDGVPSSTCSETILIPQDVDGSRDSQGFIMNRQRNTSCLNQTGEASNTYGVDLGSTSTFAAGEAFSITFLAIPRDITENRVIGFDGNDYLQFKDTDEFRIKAINVIDDLTINNPSSWTVDEWVHISIVRNTSNLVTLYVNGTGQSNTETVNEAFDYRYIGGLSDNKFRGQLDGFLIYDDELSGPEVLKIYNATKGSHTN